METPEEKIGYFPNEKGDFTITLHEEPVAFTFDEQSAVKLVNSYKSLTLRVDVLTKMDHAASQYKSRIEELEGRIENLMDETQIIERYLKFLDESFTWLKKYSNDPQIQQWIVNQYELLNVRIKNNKAALNPLSNGE